VLPRLADTDWRAVEGLAWRAPDGIRVQGTRRMMDLAALPPLRWPDALLRRHAHHHHRSDLPQGGLAAEIEASRGCPYHCSFCAKQDHRDGYRRRPLPVLLDELDGLLDQGVQYVYFIDEIFLPHRELLLELRRRRLKFGVQTRIDLWKPELLDLLGEAGCVSIEAGVESISAAGREQLDKHCRLSTRAITDLLLRARRGVSFVQASLIDAQADETQTVQEWRQELQTHGVWANQPVPVFPYPGSPQYARLWGAPDDQAWERAVGHYLQCFTGFSDIQDAAPRPLHLLELAAPPPPRQAVRP
jgi:B12-binding domain/radical SAM domain protein of rhizo-twelve system